MRASPRRWGSPRPTRPASWSRAPWCGSQGRSMTPDDRSRHSGGTPKPEELAGVAEAITDGTRVDWGRIGDSRGLSGLKLIEQLGQAYAGETVVQGGNSEPPTPVFEPAERL